jgi:hypothetical protein
MTLTLLVAALAVGGCGPRDKYYVSGTVRFPDGEPVTEGRIFVRYGPDAIRQASALIRKDGSFRVGEIQDGDGMRGGTVQVGVIGMRFVHHMSGGVTEIPLCDERYFDPETSGLVFEVPKQLRWEIVVEKPAKTRRGKAAAGGESEADPWSGGVEPPPLPEAANRPDNQPPPLTVP